MPKSSRDHLDGVDPDVGATSVARDLARKATVESSAALISYVAVVF